MSIYQHTNGEVDGCKHGVQLNDLNFDELYVEYDDIEAALVEETKIDPEEDMEEKTSDLKQSALTIQQKDLIAYNLGGSWKRFARITNLFIEADFESMEERYKTHYERAYQMLVLWGQKSQVVVTLDMVCSNLVYIERYDLLRLLSGECTTFSLSMGNLSSAGLIWNWKKLSRQSDVFSELEIANLDAEERLLAQFQKNSFLSCSSMDDLKFIYSDMRNETIERIIGYKVNNGNDVRKIKVRLHQGIEGLGKALLLIDKQLSLTKVQYIDRWNGQTITCDSDAHLDLAIFDENITEFNVIAKRKWWGFLQSSSTNVRTLT